jgi:hypothetical protein
VALIFFVLKIYDIFEMVSGRFLIPLDTIYAVLVVLLYTVVFHNVGKLFLLSKRASPFVRFYLAVIVPNFFGEIVGTQLKILTSSQIDGYQHIKSFFGSN